MGLHSITDDGHIAWHCHNPACQHHNCAIALDEHGTPITCVHHRHLEQPARPAGEPLQAHISHENIAWQPDPAGPATLVALPACACGTRMFVKAVFTDEELAAPNMTIPEYEEYQEQIVDQTNEALRLALLKYDIEIPQRVHLVKQQRITGYHQHPMVARHQQLAAQLKAIGKAPPGEAESRQQDITPGEEK